METSSFDESFSAEELSKEIGRRVVALREAKGIKVKELRDLLGYMDSGSISHLESGKGKWRVDQIYMVARFMEVPLTDLLPDISGLQGAKSLDGAIRVLAGGEERIISEREACIVAAHRFGDLEASAFMLSILQTLKDLAGKPVPEEALKLLGVTREKGLAAGVLWISRQLMKRRPD